MTRIKKSQLSLEDLAEGVLSGDRTILGRAITLIESSKPDHQQQAKVLLQKLLPAHGKTLRVGITGVPGVGKSTTIEALGTNLTEKGHKVAVLAVDPTSLRTGGSILGDKTRMQNLSVNPRAFIRPSPTSGTLGGVTKKTRETMALCEAAGFDVILVETVGVGQSEIAVSEMVDFFLVLMLPGAGDEIQGIKRGVLEIADMIAINKADGENFQRAQSAASEYLAALHILQPKNPDWSPPVQLISGLNNEGLEELWQKILDYQSLMQKNGSFEQRRRAQLVGWMHQMIENSLLNMLRASEERRRLLSDMEQKVEEGSITAALAAEKMILELGLKT